MAGDQASGGSVGHIASGLTQNELALRTIGYIRQRLSAWRDDPNRPNEVSENALNAQLCKCLDSRARAEFPMVRFDREERQGGHRSVDLSASLAESVTLSVKTYSIYEPILTIECKRLPAPSREREREYVTGGEHVSGGIQRFKLGLYAPQDELAVLIGYVQEHDADHWCQTINRWIAEFASGTPEDGCDWQKADGLRKTEEDASERLTVLQSHHARTGNVSCDVIKLHHLWIEMNRSER